MSVIRNIETEETIFIANKVGKASELLRQQTKSAAQPASSNMQEFIVSLSNEAVDIANLQDAKNSLHEVAKGIRIADQSIQQMNEYVEKMKANLNAIIKQYPPFPPGSEERVKYLRSFNAFRKQIDQLSFVPAEETNIANDNINEDLNNSAKASL